MIKILTTKNNIFEYIEMDISTKIIIFSHLLVSKLKIFNSSIYEHKMFDSYLLNI